jgi:hypothetical protein
MRYGEGFENEKQQHLRMFNTNNQQTLVWQRNHRHQQERRDTKKHILRAFGLV